MASDTFKLNRGIGLTGSIGVGKSTVVSSLRKRGWTVIESDQLARDLVKPGQPALQEIRETFGKEVFTAGGELDRARLAAVVFGDPEKRRKLEAILHPRIRQRWMAEAQAAEEKGEKVACEIPLLYEVGVDKHFESVVVVACSAGRQEKRLRERGWSSKQIQNRLKAQLTQQEKIDRADYVIWNDFSLAQTDEQLDRVLSAHLGRV